MTQPRNPNQKPDPAKQGLAGRQPAPGQQPQKPGVGPAPAQPGRPAAQPGRAAAQPGHPGAAQSGRPPGGNPGGQPAARGPMAARQAPSQQPARQPVSLPVKPVNGTPAEIVDYLGSQIQLLATRLESLRAQGAGQTTEFQQLEMMLGQVQEKLILAQNRIRRGV